VANVRSGNTFYVDAASAGGTAASFIAQKGVRVRAIVFTSSAAGDTLTLADLDASSGNSAGSPKLTIRNISATDSKVVTFNNDTVLTFTNGIWVSSISASCTACLVLEAAGSG
jgi:hypothetical protein